MCISDFSDTDLPISRRDPKTTSPWRCFGRALGSAPQNSGKQNQDSGPEVFVKSHELSRTACPALPPSSTACSASGPKRFCRRAKERLSWPPRHRPQPGRAQTPAWLVTPGVSSQARGMARRDAACAAQLWADKSKVVGLASHSQLFKQKVVLPPKYPGNTCKSWGGAQQGGTCSGRTSS